VTRNTDRLDESAPADDLLSMPHTPAGADDVTALLVAVRAGDDAARDRLFTVLYDELRRIAAAPALSPDVTEIVTRSLAN